MDGKMDGRMVLMDIEYSEFMYQSKTNLSWFG